MNIEFYSFKRKAADSKRLKVEKDKEVHWLVVFPEYKFSYCSECLYENCIHGQSFINPNVGSIFMENMDFKKRHSFEYNINPNNIRTLGSTLMMYLAQNPSMRKRKLQSLIEKNI
jgi:hypothetical protein